MATLAAKPLFLRNIAQRGYAAQASAAIQNSAPLPRQETKVTTLPSGTLVASLENYSPLSRVALVFKAGSRYETPKTWGSSHVLRVCTGLGTKNETCINITRSIQQLGAALTAESGREHFVYGLDLMRDNLHEGLKFLTEVGTQHAFKPWEIRDSKDRFKIELALRDPTTLVLEMLHAAAYHSTGLGNSLYVPQHLVGKVPPSVLRSFLADTHTSGRLAVVGVGVDHTTLLTYAKTIGVASGTGINSSGDAYKGGSEERKENGSQLATVAVAGHGASMNGTDMAAFAVAQHILGIGPGTKYGSNASSKLGYLVGDSGVVSTINVNYSDSGLFGYFLTTDAEAAGKVIKAVHNSVKKVQISEADLKLGKMQAKVSLHMSLESTNHFLDDLILQTLLTGKHVDASESVKAIDAVTVAAVQTAIKKAFGGKLSMAAIGGLKNVPRLDQL